MNKYLDETHVFAMTGEEKLKGTRRFQLSGSAKNIEDTIKSRYDETFNWYSIPPKYKNQAILATFSISKDGKLVFEGAELEQDRWKEFY